MDFYKLVNETWLNKTDIPKHKSRWGTFDILAEQNEKKLIDLIKSLDSNNQIKILFNQFINKDSFINENKKIITDMFKTIDSFSRTINLFKYIMTLNKKYSLNCPINLYVGNNYKDSKTNILFIGSGGIGLPEKNYYEDEKYSNQLNGYKNMIQNLANFFEQSIDINQVIELERVISSKFYSPVERRNPFLLNNLHSIDEIKTKYPYIYVIVKDLLVNNTVNINHPIYLQWIDSLIRKVSLDIWKNYFKVRIIIEFGKFVSSKTENIYLQFYEKELSGKKEFDSVEKYSLIIVSELLDELVSFLFIKNNNVNRKDVEDMIKHIKEQFRINLQNNSWMSEQTKVNAIKKLDNMNYKIIYASKETKPWFKLIINNHSCLLFNILTTISFNNDYEFNQIGKLVNKDKWFMPAHSVNAYYSPNNNEIVFPLGILQEPFYSSNKSLGYNYGAIGSIIGHEIVHAFDDKGSLFDYNGNLNNWWVKEDKDRFKEIINKIKEQWSKFNDVDGNLTMGENIADIGGTYTSLKALINKLNELNYKQEEIKNSIIEFFKNYASIWKSKIREEELKIKLLSDVHSPCDIRVNATLANIDEFNELFKLNSKRSKYYVEPHKRTVVWL
jgi:putative endopeptidase